MDIFKGQDNNHIFCIIVIVPHNVTNKFQPLDTVNKPTKKLIAYKYNA